jgi:hypothetical protein
MRYNKDIKSKPPVTNQIVSFARPLSPAEQALASCLIQPAIRSDSAKRSAMAALGYPVDQNELLIIGHSLRRKVNAPAGTDRAAFRAKLKKALA